ncbi:MAG: hypothetical protein QNJ89_13970 [Acidimicrobiia bacterium]|nr:hypothetical protein [Acidimicrobiia bacterium]
MLRTLKTTGAAALLLLAVGCDLQGTDVASTAPPAGQLALVGAFDWSMPDRYGLDANGDGRVDIPNTLEYVVNLDPGACASGCSDITPTFTLVLDASQVSLVDPTGAQFEVDTYSWTIAANGAVVESLVSDSSQAVVQLPEGLYDVTLEAAMGENTFTLERTVAVEDVLIVSIGDSWAGGEGNPERPGDPPLWADDGTTPDSAQAIAHDVAHRSGLAGPAQTALAIERSDPRSSVTFVFLAASGAGVVEGILESDDPMAGGDGVERTLRPQLEELVDLVGCSVDDAASCLREIDALLISAGGNDIGFAFTLGSLIALDPVLVVSPIYENLLDNLLTEVEDEIEQIPSIFETLAGALEQLRIDEVYLTAYPGSLTYAAGGQVLSCEEAGGDLLPGLEVDRNELELLDIRLRQPLNAALEGVASGQGWVFVDDHVAAFEGHGYCGSDPYQDAGYAGNPFPDPVVASADPGVRWFRQAAESVELQGGGGLFRPERLGTMGTFHPNEFGHQAYMAALLVALGY